jgi:glycosyltransferase involved in cell wall biosynthesis
VTGTKERIKTSDVPALGFFSRVSYNNGFDKLADAFIALKRENEFRDITLNVCGGYTSDDKPFIGEQIQKIKGVGFKSSVKIWPIFQGPGKEEFFAAIDIMSVPVRKYDGYGMYILESNAAGIPVVQPSTGSFPEILEATSGGILYSPDTVEELTNNLRKLLRDKEKAREYGAEGRKRVLGGLTMESMSAGMESVYKSL